MSRKSYQKVTLSVELTLPPGGKAKDTPQFLQEAISLGLQSAVVEPSLRGISVEQTIIKILKRETIYP